MNRELPARIAPSEADAASPTAVSGGFYPWYVTWLMLVIYIFNQIDRGIFGYLMEPIRRDFGLTDTELGFLAGPALVICYALLGVPVARLADRFSRVTIISIAVSAWSCIAALTGLASTWGQLALARVGVGVGEAGFSAVAQSLISDYHEPQRRTRAISIFMLALPLGAVAGGLFAGLLADRIGWRATFVAAGLPGLLLALLVKFSVREPARRNDGRTAVNTTDHPGLLDVLRELWRDPVLRLLAIAQGLVNLVAASTLSWLPAFFMRAHGMTAGELGTWFGIATGLGGVLGTWLGGHLATRASRHGERAVLRLLAFFAALVAPSLLAPLWIANEMLALALLFPANALLFFGYGPVFSLVSGRCSAHSRATMISIFILVQTALGGIVGIQFLGILSDLLKSASGDEVAALAQALSAVSLVAILPAIFFLGAGRSAR